MTTVYIESSAILALLLKEPHAPRIVSVLSQAVQVATSALTLIEVRRGLHQYKRQHNLAEGDYLRLIGFFAEISQFWIILEMTQSLQARAAEPFPVEPVRSLDAIHLASILECVSFFPKLQVLSFDKRILDNLIPLGLSEVS